MAMGEYSILSRAPQQDTDYWIQFHVMPDTPVFVGAGLIPLEGMHLILSFIDWSSTQLYGSK